MKRASAIKVRFSILLAISLVCGCKEMAIPPAGSYSEVVLVTEEGRGSRFLPQILPLISKELDYVISQEKGFNVSVAAASAFPESPPVKNIFILGTADPLTSVGKLISTLLGEEGMEKVLDGKANIFKRENVPAPGQLTVILTARTGQELEEVLQRRGAEISDIIEKSCRKRLRRHLLDYADKDLSRRLLQKYGFVIEVPTLYRLVSEEKRPPGIELMRESPTRSLGVFWVEWSGEPSLKDSLELFRIRESYVWERYDGDAMDSNRVKFKLAGLGPYRAVNMEGYWYNTRATAGGYFKTFFIFEEKENLLWAVDLLAYAPGSPKHPLFRELIALAETFRYD